MTDRGAPGFNAPTFRPRARGRVGPRTTTPTVGISAVSTGPRTLRVSFTPAARRVPPLGQPTTWAVRRPGGGALTVVRVTVQPGAGAVSYVDLETREEQATTPGLNEVEVYTIENG